MKVNVFSIGSTTYVSGNLAITGAFKLLNGGYTGISKDATDNSSHIVTTSRAAFSNFMANLTYERNSIVATQNANGFMEVVSANALNMVVYDSGINEGVGIKKPKPNLLYKSGDITTWTKANCTVTLDTTKRPFYNAGPIWRIDKTSTVDFASITHVSPIAIQANTDYIFALPFIKSSNCKHFQMKPNFSGAGTDIISNCTFEIDADKYIIMLTPAQTITGESVETQGRDIIQPGVYHIDDERAIAYVKFHNRNNDTATFQLIFDPADITTTESLWVGEPQLLEGPAFTGFIPASYQPQRSALTSAEWQTLTGNSIIGQFAANTNLVTNTKFGTGWTSANVDVTEFASGAIDGSSSFRLADNSTTVNGNRQFQILDSNVRPYLYGGMFVNVPNSTSNEVNFRTQIYTAPNIVVPSIVFTRFAYQNNWEVTSIGGTNVGNVRAECIPTSNANIVFWIAEVSNIAGPTNYRLTIFPSNEATSAQDHIEVSHPFLIKSNTPLWNFHSVNPWNGDKISELAANTSFSNTIQTIVYDMDDIELDISLPNTWNAGNVYTVNSMVFYNNSVYRANTAHTANSVSFNNDLAANLWIQWMSVDNPNEYYIFSAHKNQANNRVELFLKNEFGRPKLYGRWIDNNGANTTISGEVHSTLKGRWWLKWDTSNYAIGKNHITVASGTGSPKLPEQLTQVNHGSDYTGNNIINSNMSRFFRIPKNLTANQIMVRGNTNANLSFTNAEISSFYDETIAAANTLKARTRTGFARVKKTSIIMSMGQSLARSSAGAVPVYTTTEFLAGKNWANNCFMHGCTVRDATPTDNTFTVQTSANTVAPGIYKLIATIDYVNNVVLTNSDIQANGFPSSSYVGESPIVASAYEFNRLLMNTRGWSSHANSIIAGAVGSATDGSLAAISNTAGNNWLQFRSYISNTTNRAIGSGLAANTSEVSFLGGDIHHGESSYGQYVLKIDYLNGDTAATSNGLYRWMNNSISIANTVLGQNTVAEKPLFVASLASLHWATDGAQIAKAYRQAEDDRNDLVIASASYICQNSGNTATEHPTSWGSVILGCHNARARHYVQTLNQNWFAPRIYKVWQRANKLVVGVLAMEYPLQRLACGQYYSQQYDFLPDWGFVVWKGSKIVPIESVSIYNSYNCLIEIKLKDYPDIPVQVGYAEETKSFGRGNVFDSSPDFTFWPYNFLPYDRPYHELTGVTYVPGASGMLPDRVTAVIS